MVESVASDQHLGDLSSDFFFEEATVDEVFADFLDLVDSGVG